MSKKNNVQQNETPALDQGISDGEMETLQNLGMFNDPDQTSEEEEMEETQPEAQVEMTEEEKVEAARQLKISQAKVQAEALKNLKLSRPDLYPNYRPRSSSPRKNAAGETLKVYMPKFSLTEKQITMFEANKDKVLAFIEALEAITA